MMDKVSYDAEAIVAVAEKVRALRDNVEQTREELIRLCTTLLDTTGSLELRTCGTLDFASVVSQRDLREQKERLENMAKLLNEAAGLTDEATNEVSSKLEEFLHKIFPRGADGKIHISPADGISTAAAAIGGAFGTLHSGLCTLSPSGIMQHTQSAMQTIANSLSATSDDMTIQKAAALGAGGNAKFLQSLGVSNKEILEICETSGKKGLEAKVKEMLIAENQAFLNAKNANAKTWYGSGCVKMTYAKMKYFITDGQGPKYAKGYSTSGNGKDVVSHLADTSGDTNLSFTQTKYSGKDCLKNLLSNYGDPATDIVVSFPDVKSWENGKAYGHVVYIDAIVDGKVYLTDTADATKFRVYDSVDAFLNKYSASFGRATGAVHFQKNG